MMVSILGLVIFVIFWVVGLNLIAGYFWDKHNAMMAFAIYSSVIHGVLKILVDYFR